VGPFEFRARQMNGTGSDRSDPFQDFEAREFKRTHYRSVLSVSLPLLPRSHDQDRIHDIQHDETADHVRGIQLKDV